MSSRLNQIRRTARRALHAEAARPALLIVGSSDPVNVTVRIHDKVSFVGDMPGLETTRFHDSDIHLRFLLDEIDGTPPARGAKVSVADGEAYLLGESFDPYGDTIDVSATRLSAAEAGVLPVPTP